MSGERVVAGLRWLEITPDYRCNQRCTGCHAVSEDGVGMTARELGDALVRGRKEGATSLWIGGGEPTLRRDLFSLVREARRLGYVRVKLQTNVAMLAYADYVARLVDAGVSEVAASLKAMTAAAHDACTKVPGSFDNLLAGLSNARAAGLALEGDVLVYASTVHALPELVSFFHERGVSRFRVWSLHAEAGGPVDEVPRVSEVARAVRECLVRHPTAPQDFLSSLHTPPCALRGAERAAFDARAFSLLVVNPGGHAFRLETSPIEGGLFLPGCDTCIARDRCSGIRAAYAARHGTDEFVPLAAETR